MLMKILLELLALAPTFIGEFEGLLNEIAHGEGGVDKVAKVASGVAQIANSVNAAATALKGQGGGI